MQERFETFTSLIAKINRNIRKIKNQEMADESLRSVHTSCLYYLYASDARTATDLCDRCEEDKATISRALDHLEKSGYITREPDPQKRYKAPLTLTGLGVSVGRRIAEKIDRVLAETGESLSEDERAAFYRSLQILSDALDAIARRESLPAEGQGGR